VGGVVDGGDCGGGVLEVVAGLLQTGPEVLGVVGEDSSCLGFCLEGFPDRPSPSLSFLRSALTCSYLCDAATKASPAV